MCSQVCVVCACSKPKLGKYDSQACPPQPMANPAKACFMSYKLKLDGDGVAGVSWFQWLGLTSEIHITSGPSAKAGRRCHVSGLA
ncbi:hypothetical protein AB1N83_005988 [Pleurotus pulmonarius]